MLNQTDISKFRNNILFCESVNLIPFDEKHFNNPCYLDWLHDHEIIKYLNLPSYLQKPVSFEEIKTYVDDLNKSNNVLFYAIETKEGKFIGTCKIGPIDWHAKNVNLGILIGDKSYWRKGIAKEVFSIAIDFCFNELKMNKVTGGCMEPNTGMRKVFEKLGFKEEGCFREQDFLENKYWNHYHYGLFKHEFIKQI
ncbi:MAG: GNAT family N-acetyltransferase [Candidatus Hodarchaeota archaeon]